MRLVVDLFEDTTAADLQAALMLLGNSREVVLMLCHEDDRETFLRAVRIDDSSEKFHVDRGDSIGGRHECDERFSLPALQSLLSAFLQGNSAWGDGHAWHRVGDDHKTVKA